jgi:hypothetical protein
MSGKTGNDIQAAWIAHMKSKTVITSLLANAGQIKELQWQGADFVYPAVRFSVTLMPAVNRCLDTAEIVIDIFSEQKSSDQASTIAGAIQTLYHGHPFEQGGTKFPIVIVSKVNAPERSIYGWNSKVSIRARIA